MNCHDCGCRLNFLSLRQVIEESDKDLYEILCFNPNCKALNYLSRDGYFALKREVCLIANSVPRLTTKLPDEQKWLIISMERSGSSWLAAHISIEHMKIFGVLPKWNHECDRRYAVFKSIQTKKGTFEVVTPEGWTSVYDVNPMEALDKDFDKIILFQKDLGELKKDICKYNHPEKWLHEQETGETHRFLEKLRINIEKWWNIMFSQEIDDPRLYKVTLENLNNFTEWEFPKLYDFLGFPERSRCHAYAVNRNWQVYSDVLPTEYPLCPRLRQLQDIHPNALAQEMLQEDLFFTKLKNEGKYTDGNDYPFVNKVNPYLRIKEEGQPAEARSYRITHDDDIGDVLDPQVTYSASVPKFYIYFIRCKNLVRIGIARNVLNLMDGMKASNPYELELMYKTEGDYEFIKELHESLKDSKYENDWFIYDEVIDKIIVNLKIHLKERYRENDE